MLGLPTALEIPVLCGAASAGTELLFSNTSDQAVELTELTLEGPFESDATLPLTIQPGARQTVRLTTAAGVIGTDKPGDERSGSVQIVSSVGKATVALHGTVQGTTLALNDIPGVALQTPLSFSCSSTAGCPTRTFTIVNTGDVAAKLGPPVGDGEVVGAFIPGSSEAVTLQPGFAVRLEARPAAGKNVAVGTPDVLTLAVEGSCDTDTLELATLTTTFDSSSDCKCGETPPGVEVGTFDVQYQCGDAAAKVGVPIFNGTTTPLVVSALDGSNLVADEGVLPFTVAPGATASLELTPPVFPGSTSPMGVSVRLETALGRLETFGQLRASGSNLQLRNAQGNQLLSLFQPSSCLAVPLRLYNFGDVATTVAPPVGTGELKLTGFDAPVSIKPGAFVEFELAYLEASACSLVGSIDFAANAKDCSETVASVGLSQAVSYSAQACTCD